MTLINAFGVRSEVTESLICECGHLHHLHLLGGQLKCMVPDCPCKEFKFPTSVRAAAEQEEGK